jgi:aminopeptidase N
MNKSPCILYSLLKSENFCSDSTCYRALVAFLICIPVSILLTSAAALAQDRHTGGPLSDIQSSFNVHYYDINLRIAMDYRAISGYVDIYIIPETDTLSRLEIDLVEEFRVSYVDISGRLMHFSREGDKLFVDLHRVPEIGESLKVKIYYSGKPPVAARPPWDGGFNWSTAPDGSHWVGVSCQGEGAKMWYPAVDHPSRRPDSASVNITIPAPYVVASNGLLQSVNEEANGNLTYRWKTRYPIHTYNINISIAKYKQFEKDFALENGSQMPVVFYVLPDYYDRAEELVDMAIDKLGRLRKYYGEYPFHEEKFGIVHTDYLGMEHQTINAYGNDFRYTVIDNESFDWLLLHEMGHEWWGNKITVTDWADFWIHEGITSYTDALYLWDRFGPGPYHSFFESRRRNITNNQPVVPGSDVNSKDVYVGDVYAKGAYFMHSLRFLLGDDVFFDALKAFVTDETRTYEHYTSTDDLRMFFEEWSGTGLEDFFNLYLYTTELPSIQIESAGSGRYSVNIPNITFSIPMDVEAGGEITRYELGPEPVVIRSDSRPVVDPQNWYLKSE